MAGNNDNWHPGQVKEGYKLGNCKGCGGAGHVPKNEQSSPKGLTRLDVLNAGYRVCMACRGNGMRRYYVGG